MLLLRALAGVGFRAQRQQLHAVQRYSARQQQRVTAMSTAAPLPELAVAFVTVPSKEVGKKLAASLVEQRLAACVNIIPGVESVYWWEGKVTTDAELLLKVKTRKALVPALTAAVIALHPYDTCEVVALDVAGGSEKYLQWVLDSTNPPA